MKVYSIKQAYPIENIPFRIRVSDGFTRTDPSSFTPDELADAGVVAVDDSPDYDFKTHSLSWGGSDWVLTELSDEQKENLKDKL